MKQIFPLTLLSLFALAACTPTASVRHLSPTISGKVTRDDAPAADVHLLLSIKSHDTSCVSPAQETRTNVYGEFNFPSVKKKLDYTPLMEHYLDEWHICIQQGDITYPVYSNNRYGQGSVLQSVRLECTLSGTPACKVSKITGEAGPIQAY